MKIAFIRSVEVGQTYPMLMRIKQYISNHDIQVKLFYTEGICTTHLFPGEYEKISSDISCDNLADKIAEWGANVAISISMPDNNSLRDASVKSILANKYKIRMIMHSVETTLLLCDKWSTNNYLHSEGFNVPRSVLIHGDLINRRCIVYDSYIESILIAIKKLDFPVIIKPLWDSMSCGLQVIDDYEKFVHWITNNYPSYDVCVEEYLSGQMFSLEIVGMDKQYFFQPLIEKEIQTEEMTDLFPFNHLRIGPYANNAMEDIIKDLKLRIMSLANSLDFCGSVEVEMILHNNKFYIIEVNPRVSGITNLSSLISGVNTYQCLLAMGIGTWKCYGDNYNGVKSKIYGELCLLDVSDETMKEIEKRDDVEYIVKVTYHTDEKQCKMVVKANNKNDLFQKIIEINETYHIVPDTILSEVKERRLINIETV